MTSSKQAKLKALIFKSPTFAERFYRLLAIYRGRTAMYRNSSFGQSGEDVWFLQTLRAKNVAWANSGFYVDLGANHPVVFSATYLLYKAGWRGLTVDPIPSLCRLHRKFRPRDICLNNGVGSKSEDRTFWETAPDFFSSFSMEDTYRAQEKGNCVVLRETKVALITPADLIDSLPAQTRVNYLSIDTEGLDGEILRNWPWELSAPDIVSCEASALNDFEGEANAVLRAKGYEPIRRFEICVFWASSSIIRQLK